MLKGKKVFEKSTQENNLLSPIVVLDLDDEGEAEADRQASEAEERRGDNSNSSSSSNQAAQDVSSVPSSTPSSMPSSSHQRRITPITWDESPQRYQRGLKELVFLWLLGLLSYFFS